MQNSVLHLRLLDIVVTSVRQNRLTQKTLEQRAV
jgi:hypothetical protein